MLRDLIFDLDGTISDPAIGIIRSLNYALDFYGFPEVNSKEVSEYIGPPLDISVKKITGNEDNILTTQIISKYRERYGEIGYAENTLYNGITETLHFLHTKGHKLCICTSKPANFAIKILDFFNLSRYFSFVDGGDIGIKKYHQLANLLKSKKFSQKSIMIGDRAIDIESAKNNSLFSVGVLWGYGSDTELRSACPDHLIKEPADLTEILA